MSRLRRVVVGLLVLGVVGCSTSSPAASQPAAPAPTQEPTLAPTAEPTLAASTPTPQPTTVSVTTADLQPATARPPDQPQAAPDTQPQSPAAAPVQQALASADQIAAQLASCDPSAPVPAPLIPGSAQTTSIFRGFRDPLPPAPLYDPPGQKRIGLQAGHWLTDQVPPELRGLGGGAVGGGKQEWQVNLDVAQRTAALLENAGFKVDVLPTTLPEHYQANLFVALHADGDTTGQGRGFKIARPGFSSIPSVDDRLVDVLSQAYGVETELPSDAEHVSLRMRYYYAFNSRRYCHAVMPGVPQAIVEMAYLTNAADRQYLIGDPQKLAQALSDGIQAFLSTTP